MENEKSELEKFLEEVHKDANMSRIQTTLEDINMRLERIEKMKLRPDGSPRLWPSLSGE